MVRNACSPEEVEELENGSVRGRANDGGGFEKDGGLSRVDLDEAYEEANTGGDRTLPVDICEEKLHDDWFEGRETVR